jgi:membrane protein CcdC involved in cytochrome C biogenesis
METSALFGSIVGAVAVMTWRIRETQKPVSAAKILIPPIMMSTGFAMFFAPEMRVPVAWAIAAMLAGALLLSYPLIRTSQLTREGEAILLKRSKAFLWIILGLAALRILLRAYVEQYVSTPQTAALFFLLAFGMLLPWRIVMFLRYRKLRAAAVAT